ncbi:MAG TPA: hypothetical protein VGQ42_08720 [Candidatus Dormibacteraeota bacterium]|jgi:hypothetical protein|nr:hypothetical protein [Candidatus Dormibacteraeota bacterium]
MPLIHSTSIRTQHSDDELELPVEQVAERLGLPAAMLIRRIEAGDIPARRVDELDGTSSYRVRIADLGIAPPGEESREIRGTAVEPTERNGAYETQPDDAAVEAIVDSPVAGEHDSDDVDALDAEPAAEATAIATSDESDDDEAAVSAEDLAEIVPPPPLHHAVEVSPLTPDAEGPRAELAVMALDPRELVAGLLDRWERTLEQRIYAEQRMRFEAELTNRQAKVKQLQLELDAVRAEHAAALAEKERQLAERARELVDRERDLADMLQRPPRRGWFSRR